MHHHRPVFGFLERVKQMTCKRTAFLLAIAGWLLCPAQEVILQNNQLRAVFQPPEQGLGLVSLANLRDAVSFRTPDAAAATLWLVRLSERGFEDGKTTSRYTDGGVLISEKINPATGIVSLDSRHCRAQRSFRHYREGNREVLELKWSAVALPEDPAGRMEVTVAFELPQPDGNLTAQMTLELQSERYALESTGFPYLAPMAEAGSYDVLLPRWTYGAQFFRNNLQPYSLLYPSIIAQMPFMALLRPEGGGLYWGFHDRNAGFKGITMGADVSLNVETTAMDAGVIGSGRAVNYPWVVAPLRTAWDAAAIYRDYARQQPWLQKGKLRERTDLPPNYRDIEVWVNISGSPAEMKAVYDRVKQETSARVVAVHWYGWNMVPFDTGYPEDFPAQDGFEEVVREITANGDFVVPYLNGHCWDSTLASYRTEGTAAAVKGRDGSIALEHYASDHALAPMCPASTVFQRRIQENCRKLIAMGVNGIYLDQICQLAPMACCDTAHGHPAGGGGWWTESYRQMLEPVLKEAAGKVFLASENAAEPYIDTVSSFLVWTEITGDDFPGLTQVYNNYAFYFGALSFPEDDLRSFAATQKRCVLWGYQPGWMVWLYGQTPDKWSENHSEKIAYLNRVIDWRRELRPYLLDGELLRDAEILSANPPLRVKWHRMQGAEHDEAMISGAVWRSESRDSAALVLANLDNEERIVKFRVNPAEYGLRGERFSIREIFSGAAATAETQPAFEYELRVPGLGFAGIYLSAY